MSRSARECIADMIEACDRIASYSDDIAKEDLASDPMRFDAILRNVELLGEAAKNVPTEVRALAETVRWREISGMRDIVIHQYIGVDVDVVVDVVYVHVPSLRNELVMLLRRMENDGA